MAWRGLHLTKPSRLSFKDGQIVVEQEDGEVRIALEDLAWIVLDSPRSSLSGTLLSACMSAGVTLIVTDETHTPSGVALPFHRHHRQADLAQRQIAMSLPLKKRLWQSIVRRKIENQANALEALHRDGASTLREMIRHVGSGDQDNVEARAARTYWRELWPEFRREDDGDRRNKLLNYGYAVVRSGVARALVASGLLPAIGVNHASVTNAFNLADDLVEPFRPFVDVHAWRAIGDGRPCRENLSVQDRQAMASVLLGEARFALETVTLLVATERSAESLVRAIESNTSEALELPTIAA
jgi:CRISPR-associated protein Cas1